MTITKVPRGDFFIFEVSSFLKERQSSYKPMDVFFNSAIHLRSGLGQAERLPEIS